MVYTGKGLLDINIIKKMMEMEEALANDPEYKNFCLAKNPNNGFDASSCTTFDFIEGCWTKVRHTAQGSTWGPFDDQLTGTDVVGNPYDGSSSWSTKYDGLEFNQFLFASGDLSMWMVMKRDDVIGEWYTSDQREIQASSENPSVHTAAMNRVEGSLTDTWIGLEDHSTAGANGKMLYGGNS